FYTGLTLFWIWLIPFNHAPDEAVHYNFNVKFIYENHRLPVAGIDDHEAYTTIPKSRIFGRHSTLGSYVIYPALPYVIAAASSWITNRVFGTSNYIGARLSSMAWGLLFLTYLYLCVWRITNRRLAAFVVTFSFAFIPQVIFISAYVNSDIYSL